MNGAAIMRRFEPRIQAQHMASEEAPHDRVSFDFSIPMPDLESTTMFLSIIRCGVRPPPAFSAFRWDDVQASRSLRRGKSRKRNFAANFSSRRRMTLVGRLRRMSSQY